VLPAHAGVIHSVGSFHICESTLPARAGQAPRARGVAMTSMNAPRACGVGPPLPTGAAPSRRVLNPVQSREGSPAVHACGWRGGYPPPLCCRGCSLSGCCVFVAAWSHARARAKRGSCGSSPRVRLAPGSGASAVRVAVWPRSGRRASRPTCSWLASRWPAGGGVDGRGTPRARGGRGPGGVPGGGARPCWVSVRVGVAPSVGRCARWVAATCSRVARLGRTDLVDKVHEVDQAL